MRRPDEVAGQRVGPLEQQGGQIEDLVGFGHAPGTGVLACQPTRGRFDDHGTAATQRRDVVDGRGMLPHLGVHRGHEHHGARAVSRVAVRRSSARPATARAMRSAVAGAMTTRSASCRAGRAAPAHLGEHPGLHGIAGERLEGGAPDEFEGGLRRDDPHVVSALGEGTDQCAGLVGGDATGDTDDDAAALHGSGLAARSGVAHSPSVCSSRSEWISRMAIDSGFSCRPGSTRGPTYSRMPSPSWL